MHAAMVELRPAELLAHYLENYLRAIRQVEIAVTTEGIDVLMDGTRLLEAVINARASSTSVAMGFSMMTCIPRLTASIDCAACRPCGLQMCTTSGMV